MSRARRRPSPSRFLLRPPTWRGFLSKQLRLQQVRTFGRARARAIFVFVRRTESRGRSCQFCFAPRGRPSAAFVQLAVIWKKSGVARFADVQADPSRPYAGPWRASRSPATPALAGSTTVPVPITACCLGRRISARNQLQHIAVLFPMMTVCPRVGGPPRGRVRW